MNEEDLVKRIKELSEQYYMFGESEYTDEQFDSLLEVLRTLNPNHPILKDVGFGLSLAGVDDKEKFTHPLPMGSIDKEKDLTIARKFSKRGKWSTKIDGNSVAAYYRDGKLWKVVTRGKDDIGIDRTGKFVSIVPKTIPLRGYVRVRGEAAISKKNYTKENGFDLTKSSRNAVAGAISRKTDWESVFKYVDFIAYTFQDCDLGLDLLEQLKWSKYFKVEEQKDISEFLTCDILDFKLKYKDNYEYDADGIVLKNEDGELLAFKFEDESAITDLLDIRWTVGKDQRMTPTAILSPTNLVGATIEKASFGSFSKVLEKGCWPIKKVHKVKLIRANEIIPHIVDSVYKSEEDVAVLNPKCPHCDSVGEMNGEHIFCMNEYCPNVESTRLFNFASNFYVEGLGDVVMDKVFDSMGVVCVFDLLKYIGSYKPIKYVDGIGESTIDKVNQFLDNIKKDIDVRVIYKTYINNCGDRASNKIVDSGFDLLNYIEDSNELKKLYGLDNFDSGIIEQMNHLRDLFRELLKLTTIKQEKKAKASGTFCITGARFSKDELEYFLSKGWGEDKDLKSTTNVLVVKDKSKKTGKTEKANKYGTNILEIEEFKKIIG